MKETTRVPRALQLMSLLLLVTAVAALFAALSDAPGSVAPRVLMLLACAAVAENFAMTLPFFQVSLAFPFVVAGLVLGGPAAAGLIAAACATNLAEIRDGKPPVAVAFNFGQLVLAAIAAGCVYKALGGATLLLGGNVHPLTASAIPGAVAALLIAVSLMVTVNVFLTATAVSLSRHVSFWRIVRGMASYAPTQLALAVVGLLLAQVLAVAELAFVLLLVPLLMARLVYERQESLAAAYEESVRSLVGAIDSKDRYTGGHSERVAFYAAETCESLGLDTRRKRRVELAGLLHDLGKLTVPSSIITKSTTLTEAETDAMRRHAAVGAEMVGRIPPLSDVSRIVRQHHEWFDGGGYPDGIAGAEIPVEARILAVADAYDAMTSHRAYRCAMSHGQAARRLRAGAGTQFDPEIVHAFLATRTAPLVPSRQLASWNSVGLEEC